MRISLDMPGSFDIPISFGIFISPCLLFGWISWRSFAESLVQQGIELGPDAVFLGAGDMAIGAIVQCLHLGRWCFRLTVIEIVETPPSGVGIALGIFDGHIGTVERSGEI